MAPNNSIEYDADELEAPTWLDNEFFTRVLHNCETDAKYLRLNKLELFPATLKGDHYASVMFRAVVEYECDGQDKTKRMIVKTMPFVDGHKKSMLEESIIFETEIGMYTQVLPRFEQILRDIGDETVFKAPILFHELSPRKLIIFEDIVPLGYEVLRGRYVNSEEIKQSYAKLAKWHAISYKINLEEPGYFDDYHIGIFSLPNLDGNLLITHGIDALIQQLETMPTMRKYLPYIQSIQGKLLKGTKAAAKEYFDARKDDGLYVLCHGDFHDKNMMFKRDPSSRKLLDVMLLDYQLSYVGPLVNDLIYSYFMMLDSEQRGDFEQWLHFYHTHFQETLQKIGFEGRIPSLQQLHEQRWQHRYFELYLLMTYLPAWITIRRGEADLEEAFTSHAVHKKLYADQEFLEEFEKLMQKYVHLGYFEEN